MEGTDVRQAQSHELQVLSLCGQTDRDSLYLLCHCVPGTVLGTIYVLFLLVPSPPFE